MGPQGSGKGSQAELLAQRNGYFHMESGKMFRKMAKTDVKIAKILANGELVDDEETVKLINNYLEQNNIDFENIIFDGYPRSLHQYGLIKEFIESKGKNLDKIIFIKISEDETVKRLSSRRTCSKCGRIYNLITNPPADEKICDECGGNLIQRKDDNSEAIKKRLELFRNKTLPVIEKAHKEKLVLEINGEQPIESIYQEIVEKLGLKKG